MLNLIEILGVILFAIACAMDEDPFASIKKNLSLSKDSTESNTVQPSQREEPEITSVKKRWKAPPGYYKKENKDKRLKKRIKRHNPTLSEENLQELAATKKRGRWKYPPNHFKKDVYIKRQKTTF